jgi:hypothetical protein
MFLLGKLASKQQTPTLQPWQPALELSSWQPPCQIGCFFASADSGLHGGMMRGSGEGPEGGIGSGGEIFCLMQFLASIDHGGLLHPTAAMRPHSRRRGIQQSANMLGNKLVSSKLEKVINSNVY